ncbi:MAG: hypothetical protein IMZ61_10865 [Planctomycetes bacterium]|nr:hypothetical protein [Planctomycetota bacterium]
MNQIEEITKCPNDAIRANCNRNQAKNDSFDTWDGWYKLFSELIAAASRQEVCYD